MNDWFVVGVTWFIVACCAFAVYADAWLAEKELEDWYYINDNSGRYPLGHGE